MKTETNNKKTPNPIDIHVGSRIRLQRNMLKMSQTDLANQLGITFQQVQKYEKGSNRVGASRLQDISQILGTHVAFFFEGAPGSGTGENANTSNSAKEHMDFISTSEGIKLNRAFSKIKNPKVRVKALELIRALSDSEED